MGWAVVGMMLAPPRYSCRSEHDQQSESFPEWRLKVTCSADAHKGWLDLERRQQSPSRGPDYRHLNLSLSALGDWHLVKADIMLAMETKRFHHLGEFRINVLRKTDSSEGTRSQGQIEVIESLTVCLQ